MRLEVIKEYWQDEVWWVIENHPPVSWLIDLKYWVAHRTWDKYHLVDTHLAPGYYDTDHRLLHASFALLVDFVEMEMAAQQYCFLSGEIKKQYKSQWKKGRNPLLGRLALQHYCDENPTWFFIDCINDDFELKMWRKQAKQYRKIQDLYYWWLITKPYNEKIVDGMSNVEARVIKQHDDTEEETKKLIQLIEIRHYLWT